MDYYKALTVSSRPHYTLTQAFTAVVGEPVSARLVQRLLGTYTGEEILDGIMCMEGKSIDKPVPYLIGVIKNRRIQRMTVVKNNDGVRNAVTNLVGEMDRVDRPVLGSPFKYATASES